MINNGLAKYLYRKDGINFKYLEELPQQVKPIVTKSDAVRGFIERYFVRQTNDNAFIVEVDKVQYERFRDNPRFITAKLQWKIVGKKENIIRNGLTVPGVEEYNKMQVNQMDLTFGGLRKYIASYLEYWFAEEV